MVSRFNFRVYDTKSNQMIYPDGNGYIDFDNEDCIIDGFGILCGVESNTVKDNYILMQSTGLEGKNGKEIFEGDVISVCGEQNQIVWDEEYAGFSIKDMKEEFYMTLKKGQPLEVIGNIYEGVNNDR
ncbi:YopX family protein [uncultured Clostridium sp.]|uniref:YopX family protein n=1 Tax=uncultured Clostridium sp. TaxID=59620 RepID=UPI0025E97F38|nr:YopX family protein [uncultured Clostridium sp.]